MKRSTKIVLAIIAFLGVGICASACGTRIVLDQRAARFDDECRAAEGSTVAEAEQRLDYPPTLDLGNEVRFSYHYGLAGRTTCSYDVASGHVMRARTERGSDFDHCTDPVSYPRRHWVCSIARVLVP